MPRFKLEVYPEPKDGTYCGWCEYRHVEVDEPRIVRGCGLFGEYLDFDEDEGAYRCDACIEAEKTSGQSA